MWFKSGGREAAAGSERSERDRLSAHGRDQGRTARRAGGKRNGEKASSRPLPAGSARLTAFTKSAGNAVFAQRLPFTDVV